MERLALHDVHAALGARFGELGGREIVLAYGDVEAEARAARAGPAVADLSFRDALRVSGPDRESFLQGMLTQDVKALAVGAWAPAAYCTAKGALIAEMRVWKRADAFVLDLEPGTGARVKETLEKFIIADDVEVAVAEEARLFMRPGEDVLVARPGLADAWRQVAARSRPIGFEALEILRVEAGIPRFGQDMDEHTIPLEANLDAAISYTKGCYIGQEVIARATYRGHVNKKLSGLRLTVAVAPGAELHAGEKKVGRVTSVVRSPTLEAFIGLGYVHRDHLGPGTRLTVAGGGEAIVTALPFV